MTRCIIPEKCFGSASLDAYLDTIKGDALLTADQERTLSEAIRQGDKDARATLIRANLRLVIKIAREYLGRGLNLDDLVGEGNLGLIRAAEEYDTRFGTRFSTYAAYWIRQSIRHALINTTSTIRLPAHMIGLLTKWRRIERRITREEGQPPEADRIACELGLTDNQRSLIEHALRARRLCHESGDEWGWSAHEARDPHDSPESKLEADEECRDLARRMKRLDNRERTIITLRFGLNGQAPMTLKQVGIRLGVTREWVRKIEQRAVRKLDDAGDDDPTLETKRKNSTSARRTPAPHSHPALQAI